jgi:hypothetical protein
MRRGGLSTVNSSVFRAFAIPLSLCVRGYRQRIVTTPLRPAIGIVGLAPLRWLPSQEGSSFYSGSRTQAEVRPDDGVGARRFILQESGQSPKGACGTRHADPPDVREPLLSLDSLQTSPASLSDFRTLSRSPRGSSSYLDYIMPGETESGSAGTQPDKG